MKTQGPSPHLQHGLWIDRTPGGLIGGLEGRWVQHRHLADEHHVWAGGRPTAGAIQWTQGETLALLDLGLQINRLKLTDRSVG